MGRQLPPNELTSRGLSHLVHFSTAFTFSIEIFPSRTNLLRRIQRPCIISKNFIVYDLGYLLANTRKSFESNSSVLNIIY